MAVRVDRKIDVPGEIAVTRSPTDGKSKAQSLQLQHEIQHGSLSIQFRICLEAKTRKTSLVLSGRARAQNLSFRRTSANKGSVTLINLELDWCYPPIKNLLFSIYSYRLYCDV